MKVAFYLSKVNYGGGQRVILAMMPELQKKGFDVVCCTWNDSLKDSDVPCRLVHFSNQMPQTPMLSSMRKFIAVKRTLQKEQIDVFVSFGNEPYITSACYFGKTKLLFSLRIDPRELPTSVLQRLTYKFMLKTASGIVFQTDQVRDYYDRGIRKKSIVIPNPILDKLPQIVDNKVHKISAVGRLTAQKNFDLLLDAVHICDLKDFSIHLYGKGELEDHLKAKVKDYQLDDKVFFEGFVSNTIDAIKDSSIFVLSSDSEGMPNALIEAMAMKIACVATDVSSGGASFLLEGGKRGLLVPVGSKQELAESLQRLIDDECLRKHLGEEAVQIREKLDKTEIINRWIQYIKTI